MPRGTAPEDDDDFDLEQYENEDAEEIEEIVADHAARLDAQDLDNEQSGDPPAPAESDNQGF